ncbi:MAG: IPT/TIG domain-containing protein [Candidatus Marinimicrobia bacterium]|nr:IPT/TIG domain-containing protein [Candidatus Neomarinimicrobiota bacterium]
MGRKIFTFVTIAALMMIVNSCEDTDYPDSLYDPDAESGPAPIITSVKPAAGVYAGIDDITITGGNFRADKANNFVYFGGMKADILENSTTQIVVRAPIIEGDSLTVKVAASGANALAEWTPYKIEFAAIEYGGVTDQADAYGIACDSLENVYVYNGALRKIIKIPPDGSDAEDFAVVPEGSLLSSLTAMKMGPDGYLYGVDRKFVFKVSLYDSTFELLGGPVREPIRDFDFDQYGNIYTASKKAIYCKKPDGSYTTAANYKVGINFYILTSARVYDSYVYVSGSISVADTTLVQSGIWRNKILSATGDLDTNELVFDWEGYVGATGPAITAITFSADGTLYVGADAGYAIVMLEPAGDNYLNSVPAPLYQAVLLPPSTNFCWGTGQYLYVNRKSSDSKEMRLIRITMGKESATYWGRQ